MAIVQSKTLVLNGGTTANVAFDSNVTAGNYLVFVYGGDQAGSVPSFAVSPSDTIVDDAGDTSLTLISHVASATGGATTCTINTTGVDWAGCAFYEIDDTIDSVDDTGGSSGSSDTPTTGTITTTGDGWTFAVSRSPEPHTITENHTGSSPASGWNLSQEDESWTYAGQSIVYRSTSSGSVAHVWQYGSSSAWTTAIASYKIASSGITASASITEADDTLSGAGGLDIAASASVTEAGDSLSGAGSLDIAASAAITEAGDALSATASTEAASEADDWGLSRRARPGRGPYSLGGYQAAPIDAFSDEGILNASATITEADDTLASAVSLDISAGAGITEGGDSTSAAASLAIAAGATLTQDADSTASAVSVAIAAAAALTEDGDSLSATAGAPDAIVATATITEADDTSSAAVSLAIVATATITEAGDTSAQPVVVVQTGGGLPSAWQPRRSPVRDFIPPPIHAVARIREADDVLVSRARMGRHPDDIRRQRNLRVAVL